MYFVIYQPSKYIEDCGVEIAEFLNLEDTEGNQGVNTFLTDFLKCDGEIIAIFKGERLEWEKYEVATKAKLK